MSNRYYTPDSKKWIRQTRITEGPSTDPSKVVYDFIFDADAHPSVATAAKSYAEAFEVLKGTREFKATAKAAGRYTDLGVTEVLSEFALTDALPRLKRARTAVDRAWEEIEQRKTKFVPAPPSSTDVIGEMQRSEVRKLLRDMEPAKRNEYLQKHSEDPTFVQAVIHAPPALSGVEPAIHSHLRDRQIELEHGDAIAELNDRAEVLQVADDVLNKAREQLREDIGLAKGVFENIATVAETNGGVLPFRVDREEGPGGQPIEVAKVYDLAARQWRLATSNEIQQSTRAA